MNNAEQRFPKHYFMDNYLNQSEQHILLILRIQIIILMQECTYQNCESVKKSWKRFEEKGRKSSCSLGLYSLSSSAVCVESKTYYL